MLNDGFNTSLQKSKTMKKHDNFYSLNITIDLLTALKSLLSMFIIIFTVKKHVCLYNEVLTVPVPVPVPVKVV